MASGRWDCGCKIGSATDGVLWEPCPLHANADKLSWALLQFVAISDAHGHTVPPETWYAAVALARKTLAEAGK